MHMYSFSSKEICFEKMFDSKFSLIVENCIHDKHWLVCLSTFIKMKYFLASMSFGVVFKAILGSEGEL